MDRDAWRVAVFGVAKSQTQLSDGTELISGYSHSVWLIMSSAGESQETC